MSKPSESKQKEKAEKAAKLVKDKTTVENLENGGTRVTVSAAAVSALKQALNLPENSK